jgi:hypothetical protein
MKNNTLKRGAPKRGLAAHPAVIAAQIGYSDMVAGRPFDTWRFTDQIGQANYEIGRLWGLNLRIAGIDPPKWTKGKNLPASVRAMLSKSFDMVGGCQPGEGDGI